MEEHLNDDQIDQLLRPASNRNEESISAGKSHEDSQAHLKICELCRSRVQAQERAMDQLALLRHAPTAAPGAKCPPESVWIEIASGMTIQDSEGHLSHATACDHCGRLLQQSFADVVEAMTPEEETLFLSLESSDTKWQKNLAVTLKGAVLLQKQKVTRSYRHRWWLSTFLAPRSLAYAAVLAGVLTLGMWFAIRIGEESRLQGEKNSAAQLLASAYVERRVLEIRMEGAPYVPLRQDRGENGDQNRMSRPALLKAEAETAQHLQSVPDDVEWLQASGRASLLEDNASASETAVTVLEKAHRLAPNDQSINIDLASAYLLRGQLTDRPEDYGVAADILARVLVVRPEDEVAQFNRAIALEKLLLKVQAKDAWQAFLKTHPASPWAPEAQERLTRLQQEVGRRNERTGQPLKSLEHLAAAFVDKRDSDIADIDSHIEEYQERSIQAWLPAYFAVNDEPVSRPGELNIALSGLAILLKDRHGDHWLGEMLTADRHSPQLRRAVQLLSHSDQMVQSSDDGPIEQEATEASRLFHQTGSPAGELRSQLVLAIVEQLQHRRRPCKQTAQLLLKGLAHKEYAWIETQTELEAGICADTSDKQALRNLETGSALAAIHHYRGLALRATMFESGLFWVLGDQHHAWSLASNGLRAFWAGDYPNIRGYNMLVCLDDLVATHDQLYLEVSVLKEAVPMIDSEPRPAMAAFEHARLGQIQIESGDTDGAEKSFYRSRQIFSTLSAGRRREALSAEADLGLAKVQYQRGDTRRAEEQLQRIRPVISQLPDDRLLMDYYQTSGRVGLRAGKLEDAEKDFNSAVELAEARLRLVTGSDDRWQWSHRNEASYRAMVELQLRKDPAVALRYWEWYKGAPLRARPSSLIQDAPAADRSHGRYIPPRDPVDFPRNGPGTALVTYFMASSGAIVWVTDSAGIHEVSLNADATGLSNRINHFAELCSNPNSSVDQIKREGSQLYETLLKPIEPWLAKERRLIVEPDGAMANLPFELLVESDGRYLLDHFDVMISPGTAYLKHARDWSRISSATKLLVIGNPEVAGWSSLPEAEQEAQSVADLFPKSHRQIHQAWDPAVKRELADAEVFHFAGHATATIRSAGLITDNGWRMDAHDFDTLSRGHIRLAVLSACVSSYGSRGSFDDQDSLVRRLMGARVPEVVASRWQIDSTATSRLMNEFYKNLIAGDTVSGALTIASRTLRTEPGFAHPYYWAGFSAFGRN